MAFDAYIKIDGIPGDSTDKKHEKWIEVQAFNHSISQIGGGSSSAQGTHTGGKADHSEFQITKALDSASPVLAAYCCDGKPIPNITLELCRAMGDKVCFMKYVFKDSIISSVQVGGGAGGSDMPVESISIRYGQILWEYTPTDPKTGGKTGASIKQGWDTFTNEKVGG